MNPGRQLQTNGGDDTLGRLECGARIVRSEIETRGVSR
jgi:hypothetical protein